MAIKKELIISAAEINKLIQLIINKVDLIFPDAKNENKAGTTDNTIKGKLIKIQNLVLDKMASVCSQKNTPRNVKLIFPFLFMTMMWSNS